MKTNFKLLALSIFAGTIISTNNVSAQDGGFSSGLGGPIRTEVQTTKPLLDFTYNPTATYTVAGTPLTGVGINIIAPNSPQYMLDILCDPSSSTNNDVNVSTTAATQNVG